VDHDVVAGAHGRAALDLDAPSARLEGIARAARAVRAEVMAFTITDSCSGCARCKVQCPASAILGTRGERHGVVPERCIDCGACAVVCPDAAVLDERGELHPLAGLIAHSRLPVLACGVAWPTVRIDPRRCTGCGDCVSACGYDALSRGGGRFASERAHAISVADRCTGCGSCELVCGPAAIEVSGGGLRLRA
jgi:MinD superfamily P-loop ATPase